MHENKFHHTTANQSSMLDCPSTSSDFLSSAVLHCPGYGKRGA